MAVKTKVSAPPPPVMVSRPAPPVIRLALESPVRVSLNFDPIRFSIAIKVSEPAPWVFWAEPSRARLTVTAAVALA